MHDRNNTANTTPIPPNTDSTANIRATSNIVSLKNVRCPSEYPVHCPDVQSEVDAYSDASPLSPNGKSQVNNPAPTLCNTGSPSAVGSR